VRSRAATPQLQVVSTRRQAVRLAAVLGTALFVLLFAVTAFQTRLAQNQLEIDRTDEQIGLERERYDRLRLERAELLAPDRLMTQAAALGMVPGSSTEFVAVPSRTVAEIAVSASGVPESARRQRSDPFEGYGQVKAMVDGPG
jgi:cell division protein FtsL